MPVITTYLFFTILMSPIIILLGHYLKRNMIVFTYGIFNTLLSSWLLVDAILKYGVSESTIDQKIGFFFHNDVSMIFYFIYIPLIIIGSILPTAIYVIKHIETKSN